jgi:hypothetical protein
MKGRAANLLAAYIKLVDENGNPEQGATPLAMDATQLTQAVDIDESVLGGLVVQLYGQGRVLIEGLEVQYLPKPTSRIPG